MTTTQRKVVKGVASDENWFKVAKIDLANNEIWLKLAKMSAKVVERG